jgi:uncharacterized membrane protein (DUF485 family)
VGVLYTCMTLLALLCIVSLIRVTVYALVWVLFGKNFWLIPNLFSEEVRLTLPLGHSHLQPPCHVTPVYVRQAGERCVHHVGHAHRWV